MAQVVPFMARGSLLEFRSSLKARNGNVKWSSPFASLADCISPLAFPSFTYNRCGKSVLPLC